MKSVEPAHLPLLDRAMEKGLPFGSTPLVTCAGAGRGGGDSGLRVDGEIIVVLAEVVVRASQVEIWN